MKEQAKVLYTQIFYHKRQKKRLKFILTTLSLNFRLKTENGKKIWTLLKLSKLIIRIFCNVEQSRKLEPQHVKQYLNFGKKNILHRMYNNQEDVENNSFLFFIQQLN